MFAPPDGHDFRDKYKTLKEATRRDSVREGVEWYLDGGRYFAWSMESRPYPDHVVRNTCKEKDTEYPSKRFQHIPISQRELLNDKLHVNMSFIQRNLRDAEADNYTHQKGYNLECSYKRQVGGPEKNVDDSQEHHYGKGDPGYKIHGTTEKF